MQIWTSFFFTKYNASKGFSKQLLKATPNDKNRTPFVFYVTLQGFHERCFCLFLENFNPSFVAFSVMTQHFHYNLNDQITFWRRCHVHHFSGFVHFTKRKEKIHTRGGGHQTALLWKNLKRSYLLQTHAASLHPADSGLQWHSRA